MSFKACFICEVHTVKRTQSLRCGHKKYSYDWKKDMPNELDAVTPKSSEKVRV